MNLVCYIHYTAIFNFATLSKEFFSSIYGVIVVSGDEINNTPRDIIAENSDQLPPPYPGRNGIYTAAVWNNIEDVPLTFIVGDGETTLAPDGTEYVNRRLSENTPYAVFHYARLQSDTGAVVRVGVTSDVP